jgi:hypothetical protein
MMKSILQMLRFGYFERFWPYVSVSLVLIFGPRVAAYLTYLSIDWGPASHGPVVLCPFRESFVKDIYEMRRRTNINFAIVMGGITRFQQPHFPNEMRVQAFYQSYAGWGRQRALNFSRQYANHLINIVEKKRKVHAVMSANFDYWQEVGLKDVCRERNIPFLVLSREHPVIPSECINFIDWYVRAAYVFSGDLIAVAGDSTKKCISATGTICPDDRVFVTGLPRFDVWHDIDCSLSYDARKTITLLTFTHGYGADNGFVECLRIFIDAAERYKNSGLRFLIKTKDAHDQKFVFNLIPSGQRKFIECSYTEDLFAVLPASRCVIGYNSLSQVEAALAECYLIVPAWGECVSEGDSAMYNSNDPIVADIVEFANSENDLKKLIDLVVNDPTLLPKKSRASIESFVSRFINFSEGFRASDIVAGLLLHLINDRGNRG